MKRFLLLASACTLIPWGQCCVARADDLLRVITYNVQFLPDPVSHLNERPQPEYRARQIAKAVSGYDIVALQETFNERHRACLLDEFNKQVAGKLHTLKSPTPAGFFTSGGCLVIAKRPLLQQHSMVFHYFSKPSDYGSRADGFAAKGVLHARVECAPEKTGQWIDVFVTHLEARADALRPQQYQELAKFIKQHASDQHPALVMGDLNTRGGAEFRQDPDSQHAQLMQALAAARAGRPWIDLWAQLYPEQLGGTTRQESADVGKRIDYLLLSNPTEPHASLKPLSAEVHLFPDEKVTALSDHNALSAVLEWQ